MATAIEFKYNLRLQLANIEKLLALLDCEDPDVDAAVTELKQMKSLIVDSLSD